MRWPWSGIQEELALLREQHHRHIEEYRRFTTELILDMHRHAEERERVVNQRLAEVHDDNQRLLADHAEFMAEQVVGREALLRMIDRLGPAPGAGPA